jgi:hypothetical protein
MLNTQVTLSVKLRDLQCTPDKLKKKKKKKANPADLGASNGADNDEEDVGLMFAMDL